MVSLATNINRVSGLAFVFAGFLIRNEPSVAGELLILAGVGFFGLGLYSLIKDSNAEKDRDFMLKNYDNRLDSLGNWLGEVGSTVQRLENTPKMDEHQKELEKQALSRELKELRNRITVLEGDDQFPGF